MDAAAVPQARTQTQSFVAALPRALIEALSHQLTLEQERWFPWCVVAFGAGIVVYFALGTEPSRLAAALVALAAIAFSATGFALFEHIHKAPLRLDCRLQFGIHCRKVAHRARSRAGYRARHRTAADRGAWHP
jgi:hypothetical protein